MVKKRIGIVLIIIGLLCFAMSLLLPILHKYQLMFAILGILFDALGIMLFRKHQLIAFCTAAILLFIALWITDFVLVSNWKRVPILSFQVKSTKDVNVYNALYYRVWDCDGTRTLDLNYQKKYQCSINALEKTDINVFMGSIHETYKERKEKFVRIKGKVSAINGMESLEMQGYEKDENSLNGNVSFNDSMTLEFHFNAREEKLSTMSVYDSIVIIGRIEKLEEKDSKTILHLKDAYLEDDDSYKEFSVSVDAMKACEKDKKEYAAIGDYTFFTSCLNHVYVTYQNDDVYEASYALEEGKVTLNQLLTNYDEKTEDINNNKLYRWNNYSIMVCYDNEVILGNKYLSLKSELCSVPIDEQESV